MLADDGGPTLAQMPAVTSLGVDFGAPCGCPIDGDGFARCDVPAVELPEPGAANIAPWLALGLLARRIQARRAVARSRQNAPVE